MKRPTKILRSLGFCSCGSDEKWEIVKLILERADKKASMYDEASDASSRWVEFAAHVLDGRGLLEHGMSIGRSWLTNDGEELLAFLREHGNDGDKWPEEDVNV